jgi:hypothetical protein
VRIAYADPPYPGCAYLYKDHPDYAGEVDHAELLDELAGYDGWCLHTSSVALPLVLGLLGKPEEDYPGVRIMAWVKPFAAFKRNVSVAYAWEPVLVKAARKPVVKAGMTYRDFISEPITLKRGLTGAKPERVCRWLFEVMGCEPEDELHDLFPGTGAVMEAWETWKARPSLFQKPVSPWAEVEKLIEYDAATYEHADAFARSLTDKPSQPPDDPTFLTRA